MGAGGGKPRRHPLYKGRSPDRRRRDKMKGSSANLLDGIISSAITA